MLISQWDWKKGHCMVVARKVHPLPAYWSGGFKTSAGHCAASRTVRRTPGAYGYKRANAGLTIGKAGLQIGNMEVKWGLAQTVVGRGEEDVADDVAVEK